MNTKELGKDFKKKLILTLLIPTFLLFLVGVFYILKCLDVKEISTRQTIMVFATLGIVGTVSLALNFTLIYDLLFRKVYLFFRRKRDAISAYKESLVFPFKYALFFTLNIFVFLLLGTIFLFAFADLQKIDVLIVFIGGFISIVPNGVMVYFITQNFFIPINDFLFSRSGLETINDNEQFPFRTLKFRLFFIFIVISLNSFLGLVSFYVYHLYYLGIEPEFVRKVLINSILISGVGLTISVVLAYFLSRDIIEPIKVFEENIKSIAKDKGNLNRRIEIISYEEVGFISGWFNIFLGNLRNLVLKVREVSWQVAEISEGLSAASEEINATSQEVTSVVNTVAESANSQLIQVKKVSSFSRNIEMDSSAVLEAAQKARRVIQKVDESATSGKHESEKIVENINILTEKTQTTTEKMRNLNDVISQIGDITEAIKAVAVQTNLLALNAAIESARAGHHGLGFGVISQEVRNLNDDTSVAARRITELISEIQNSTQEAIEEIAEVSEQVEISKSTIEETGEILQKIASNVQETKAKIKEINKRAESQMNKMKKVVNLIDDTAQVSEGNASATEQVSASSEEQLSSVMEISDSAQILADSAQRLQILMKDFKVE